MKRMMNTRTATASPICPINVAAPFNRTYTKPQAREKCVSSSPSNEGGAGQERPFLNATEKDLQCTCNGVSSPLSSVRVAMTWPHSVWIPTAVTCKGGEERSQILTPRASGQSPRARETDVRAIPCQTEASDTYVATYCRFPQEKTASEWTFSNTTSIVP